MSIIFFGSPEFAVPSLKTLINAGENVSLVVTQPDKARGRGKKTTPSPVKQCALSHDIKTATPLRLKDESFISELEELTPEFIITVAYGRIIPDRILELPTIAPLNIHASLLPMYRGAAPINWAIMNGDATTGVTTMIMASGLDTGDILLKETMPIEADDTAGSLSEKLSQAGGPLLLRTLSALREGSITPTPQGEPTTDYARMLTKEDGHIDWAKSAETIHNMIRALSPWPSAYTFTPDDKRMKIIRTEAIDDAPQSDAEPGTVINISKKYFDIAALGSTIRVHELQPEGKRAMMASQYLSGRALKEGIILK